MNYKETLEALDLAVLSGAVPLIIGESGIGKTSLIREYAEEKGLYLVNIDANLLKEGEIGGLPTVVGGRTRYATHHKLTEIDEYLEKSEGSVLLFIDEINRCDHSVQQELMNLILNREINGYRLSGRVVVAAAMNPSNRMEDFSETDYQVVDMDPAQEDRFVWFNMDSDSREWITWGMEEGEIHPLVIQFISQFREYLNYKPQDEFIRSTPRSWERVSNALKVAEIRDIDQKTLYNVVKGNVGMKVAQDFMAFIEDNRNPLVSPDDLFSMEVLSQFVKDEISQASHSRLYILAKNMILYLRDHMEPGFADRYSEVLNLMPKDLRISVMKEIRADYGDVYPILLNSDTFIEGFFQCYGRS
ncbi:ATP-binding protein [Youngiibacter fragilis]|uniref:ATPase AAA n=1 Tax=Youngiibacter fragilis 232.1 TaxID=994573 RepID=V7I1B5_9CLOT|nr:ATP-binding protein [Youngiibacter fragilis]ETA79638.1 ATPase AAA [Youngiibacter fragilis 232.1]